MGLAVRTLEPEKTERLSWRPEFEVGHPVVDAQHRALFHSINRLFELSPSDRIGRLVELLDELIMEAMQHFRDEEEILSRRNAPALEPHRRAHLLLVARMLTLRDGVQARTIPLATLLDFLADVLVEGHIRGEDRRVFGG